MLHEPRCVLHLIRHPLQRFVERGGVEPSIDRGRLQARMVQRVLNDRQIRVLTR